MDLLAILLLKARLFCFTVHQDIDMGIDICIEEVVDCYYDEGELGIEWCNQEYLSSLPSSTTVLYSTSN